jgi:hypothetical protein
MDLLDFEGEALYFDDPPPENVTVLLAAAADSYGQGESELPLLQAYFFAPEHLMVIVALYRFFYYQHRYPETLIVAERALTLVGRRLHFPDQWSALTPDDLLGENKPMSLIRFYLLALKGAAYVCLRLGQLENGKAMVEKILELDPEDRLNASVLKNVLDEATRLRLVVSNP